MEQKNKRILIFNVNWLGDVLFSTATIRNVRRNFPDSYIACIVPSRCYQIVKDNPHLNEIIIYDEKDRHRGVLSTLKFVQTLRDKRFDVVYLLHRSFTRALLCRLAGIRERVGHVTRKRAFLLTKKIPAPHPHSVHRIDYYLSVIENAGLRVEDRYTEFFFSAQDQEYAQKFLKQQGITEGDFVVALNPAGNWIPKRWPQEYWAQLADVLIERLGARVIITGSVADTPLVNQIQSLMIRKPIVACGVFNLKQLGALCKRLDVFVSGDTGPLHIANAVNTKKIVALFGPTSRALTGPQPQGAATVLHKDVGCVIPCYVGTCASRRCMMAITPDEVFRNIESLKKNG
jgi:heptosyltransferase-2/heptosyltransferase-3